MRTPGSRRLGALLLDFDHTLADLGRWVDWRGARDRIQELYRRVGLDATDLMRRRGTLSPMAALDAALAAHASPARAAAIKAEAFAILEAEERKGAQRAAFLPGAAALLDLAAGAGIALGIVSANAPSAIAIVLERFGHAGAFGAVIGRTAGVPLKPAPDMYVAALRALGRPPDAALAIGDSASDVRGAVAAGVEAVGVLGGEAGEDALFAAGAAWVVQDLTAVPPLLAFWAAAARGEVSGT